MPPLAPKLGGARVPRLEDPRLLTGQGSYVDDHRPARMLHAAFLRSPHAHARIVRIDAEAARALPGVAAVLTGEDIARDVKPVRAGSRIPAYKVTYFPALAQGKVRYTGEAVAMVAAESRYLAEDALDCIVVEYEPRPAVGARAPRGGGRHPPARARVRLRRRGRGARGGPPGRARAVPLPPAHGGLHGEPRRAGRVRERHRHPDPALVGAVPA